VERSHRGDHEPARHEDPEPAVELPPVGRGRRLERRSAQARVLSALRAVVQRRGDGRARLEGEDALAAALRGFAGSGRALPFLTQLQRAFGAHDLSGIRAHIGGAAADATRELGAHAYASGEQIAFAEEPDLYLVAHEVAHVVQQRAGVALPGAVSVGGDAYERQADAVAEAVVGGRDAAPLLGGEHAGARGDVVQGEWHRGDALPTQPGLRPEAPPPGVVEPFTVYHFTPPRPSSETVLLIGGMHGNERSGIEVVDDILDHLRTGRFTPRVNLYVIPVLNVANAGRGRTGSRLAADGTDPNRDYPDAGQATGRATQPETRALMAAIARIHPTRIVQVHGTIHHDQAGISRNVQHGGANDATASNQDRDTVLAMAREMRARGEGDMVQGNQPRGNRDPAGWSQPTRGSLGNWGAAAVPGTRAPMSVITVETRGNEASVDRGAPPDRARELMTEAQVIEQFLL
jgi:hypothetical protein